MTREALKDSLWPAIISAVITFIGSSLYHQLSTVREMGEISGEIKQLRAVIETYVPSMERRVTALESDTDINTKLITANRIEIAKNRPNVR